MPLRYWASSALVLLVLGCNNSPPTPVASDSSPIAPPVESAASLVETPIDADIANWEEIQKWVSTQRGKVVVIDIWSTS